MGRAEFANNAQLGGGNVEILELKMKKNKKEYSGVTSDGELISLTPDAIVKYGVKVGEIDEAVLDEAVFESACSLALSKAMVWLTASYRSESELRKYLRERKYGTRVANYVVDKLKEYNFLSDEALAKNYVEFAQKKVGVYMMRQKLMQKGKSVNLQE